MFLLASHVIWGFINGLQGVIRSLNLSGEGKPSEVSYFGKWMKNNCEGAWRGCPLSAAWMWMWLAERASKMYEVLLIIVRLRCSCPRAVSLLSSALGTLQLRPDSFDGNYCLRSYFTDQTHFLSERNFNISNYRGSQQRESTRVYLQMWSLIRPQLELRHYL